MHPKQQKHIARHDLVAANALWVPSYESSCHPRAKKSADSCNLHKLLAMTHVRPKNAKIDQHGRPLLEPWLIGVGPSPGCLFMFRLLQPLEDRKAKSYY